MAFSGKFKEQASSSSAWLPVLSNRVPEPRPGTCVNDTETLPDTVLNFIRSHPLMDSAVMHDHEKPVFFKRDVFFTRLVVDKIKVDIGGAVLDYTVYYAGTSKLYFYFLFKATRIYVLSIFIHTRAYDFFTYNWVKTVCLRLSYRDRNENFTVNSLEKITKGVEIYVLT